MKPKIDTDIEWKKIGDESLILVPTKSAFYKLNSTGTMIFDLMKKGSDNDKIVDKVCKEYGIDKSRCKEDVADFVKELRKSNIVAH